MYDYYMSIKYDPTNKVFRDIDDLYKSKYPVKIKTLKQEEKLLGI